MTGKLRLAFILFFAFCIPAICLAKPAAEEFGKLPVIGDIAISPDGETLALFVNIDGNYAVRLMPIDGDDRGEPRIMLLPEETQPKFILWASDDYVLASMRGSFKVSQTPITGTFLYVIDRKAEDVRILIKPRGVFRQFNDNIVDILPNDPNHILMQFADRNTWAPDIQKVNLHTGEYERIKRGSENIQNWVTDQRGEPRVGVGLKDNRSGSRNYYMTIRDADKDEWREADEYPGLDAGMTILGFTSDPHELIVRANRGRDTEGIYIYNLTEKKFTQDVFHSDQYDAGSVIMSDDRRRIIGARYTGETSEIVLFEESASAIEKIRSQLDGFTVNLIDETDNGDRIVFSVSNGYTPPQIKLYDINLDVIYNYGSRYPGLPAADMGIVSTVKYSARDGAKIPAYVTLPPKVKSGSDLKELPFIILPHGGPYARESGRFDYFAQFFASRGYGVLQMNFRGSSGYGEAFKTAGRENWEVMLDDVEDGTRWLIEKGYADPDRICVAGWSFGGYAALMSAIRTPDLYQCSISMAGVTDLDNLIRDAKKYRFGNIAAKQSILSGFENWRDRRANSPEKRADELTVPLFIAHGTLDQAVHFDHFTRMKRALRGNETPVTYVEFEDEDHYLSYQKNRVRFFEELDVFLAAHLGESEWALD